MQLLKYTGETLGLVNEALSRFVALKSEGNNFVAPFILFKKGNETITTQLETFSEECIGGILETCDFTVNGFVLAGETQLLDKTGKEQHFFVLKLVVDGLENVYVYSVPFSPGMNHKDLFNLTPRFAGSEPNGFFPSKSIKGEESSCNALKMDDLAPYDYRAAFLIGHFDETRLWHDTRTIISDTYCKLAFDKQRRYEFIFEISKFGEMTETMKEEFNRLNTFFTKNFASLFSHIKSAVCLENTASIYNMN